MKSKQIKTNCIVCNQERFIPLSHFKRGEGRFCSRNCKGKWSWLGDKNPRFGKDRSGALNANWRGGVSSWRSKIYHSKQWREWRQSVFERDNFTCQVCYKRGSLSLNANHIKRFVDHPDLRFDINNGVTLCSKCHRSTVTNHELEWEAYFTFIINQKMEIRHA